MTSTGPQRSLCLLFALLIAGAIAVVPGCKEPEPTQSGGSSTSTGSGGENASNTGGSTQDPADVDSEPLRVVLSFQEAILDLELEQAQAMVDEESPAYQSVATAIVTLNTLENNPNIPEDVREMSLEAIRGSWRGATAEEVANEGGSAIIAVTRSNGDIVDVNLNFYDNKWLINSPDDLMQLR